MTSLKVQLEEIARSAPGRLAVQFKDRQLTYSDVVDSVRRLEATIGRLDGMRILTILPDSFAAYLVTLYCFITKAALVPVSIRSVSPQIERICERISPHLIITTELLYKAHQDILKERASLIIKQQDSFSGHNFSFDFLGNDFLPTLPVTSAAQPEDIQLILFTSGTTGTPKGVCLSEYNILAAASMMVDFLSLGPDRRSLVTVPLYDYYGLIQIFGHILAATGFIFGENMTLPGDLFRRITHGQATDLVLVPYTLRRMFEILGKQASDVTRALKVITSSSDILSDDLLRCAFELNPALRVFNIYGLTEAGRACYREIVAFSPASKSVGHPSRGVEIQIDGDEREPGEIVIRGPNVMRGYFDAIRSDRVTFSPCHEVRTGDLGYFDENGEIVLVGRSDHMISLMGMKIHPSEVEAIALAAPDILEAHAYASETQPGHPSVWLDVVPSGSQVDKSGLLRRMRNGLPRAFVPTAINVVDKISRTELGGKILRKKVKS